MELARFRKTSFQAGSQVDVGTKATAILGLGAILVGGYSHAAKVETTHVTTKTVAKSQRSGFVPRTFGIATQTEGPIYKLRSRFELGRAGDAVGSLKVGETVVVGARLWIPESSKLAVVSGRGAAILVEGPSAIEIADSRSVETLSGSFRVIGDIEVRTPYSSATTEGEYAAWISENKAQYVAVRRKMKIWNPHFQAQDGGIVELLPGWFTEASPDFPHAQPARPRMVEPEKGSNFLAALDSMWEPSVAQETGALLFGEKKTAADVPDDVRGSRTLADIREKENSSAIEDLKEKIMTGVDDVYPAIVAAGPKKRTGRSLASEAVRKSPKFAPGFQIRVEGKKLNEEQRTLLESLKEEVPRY